MLTADHLQFFLQVSRHGRLNEASRVLGVDHTTVGRRITKLEKSIGTRLFDRTPSGWRLTEAGHRLVTHAETVESALVAAFEGQQGDGGGLTGAVRIATPDGFGAFVLTPELASLRSAHPDLNVELVTATEHDALATREFDIAVTLEEPSPRFLVSRKLGTYSLRLYATRDHLARHTPVDSVEALREHTLISYVDALLDVAPLRVLDTVLPGARVHIQTNNIAGQWMSARFGVGIALLPNFIGEPDDRLVPVLPDRVSVERTYWTAIPRDLTGLARVKAVHRTLRSSVADNPYLTLAE
ncbi:LysR family transcriptional regulator [Rhodococcus sp. NPDC003994]